MNPQIESLLQQNMETCEGQILYITDNKLEPEEEQKIISIVNQSQLSLLSELRKLVEGEKVETDFDGGWSISSGLEHRGKAVKTLGDFETMFDEHHAYAHNKALDEILNLIK